MPKKQPTAAKKARQRQAETGEKYTKALRAQAGGPVRFRAFSADGAGWAPLIERTQRRLWEVWPDCPRLCWSEKYGTLRWTHLPVDEAPREAWRVLNEAERESSVTCQTCPSPGRRRVVCTWDDYYGWVMPWVKTCCDACYHLPERIREDWTYLHLAETYDDVCGRQL